ncbi:MAG: molecular chaperone HtpG [Anaerovoracaceae bacterium]|nr:molecular chaperone HtpG [Anaerovoracaceae bacterium]
MAKKQFRAESKRLLDMMINSIYTHREIFLREIISNASDASDKLYYKGLSEKIPGIKREDFEIRITPDREARTLTISDKGIGMTKEQLYDDLGVIAKSGSGDFKSGIEENDGDSEADIDIIGQFGVGFYSAFMVAKHVTVISKAYGEDTAYIWESDGADGYTVRETEKDSTGTDVILTLRDDTEDDKYSEYLDEWTIRQLVTKYSDYIRYPITMMCDKTKVKEGTEDLKDENGDPLPPEYEHYSELETLNSMVPLWKRRKSDISDEDYSNFYKDKYYDNTDPLKVIHTNVDGVISYSALLYIPGRAPYDYYSKNYEKGLQLYSSGVKIMDKCPDLLPDYFSFVKGLVDSQDLSLNISREMLQHDRQLRAIEQRLEKKIQSELLDMQEKERDKYEEFWKNFGLQIKFGIYDNFGMNKDKLQDLLMFYSSSEKKLVTLKEYTQRMAPDQENIFYASGEDVSRIDKLPQTEAVKDRGFEILYLTDAVDEFAVKTMMDYDGKTFKSISDDDIDLGETEEEKKAAEEREKSSRDMLDFMKDSLDGKVTEVRLSQRLRSHPVCLTTKGGISMEMEKVLNAMPDGSNPDIKAQRVLEINAGHPIMSTLEDAFENDKDTLRVYTEILYDEALLIEGMPVEDPVEFSNKVCDLMTGRHAE